MLTPEKLLLKIKPLTKVKKFLVAYSGGLDSHVLLHIISRLSDYQVRAIHVHHGLQEEADSWVCHCQNICDTLDISLVVKYLSLNVGRGESLEDVARNGRYQVLKQILKSDEILITAHHQNDQAETLLLQLFRGAGVQGLASMPEIHDFGVSKHARPILDQSRADLEIYAQEYNLDFIEDPSNKDTRFDRNFLRQELFPQLRVRWKGIDKTLSRVARIQGETKKILDELAKQDLKLCEQDKENTLSIQSLLQLSYPRQKLVIRYWVMKSGFSYPSEKKLEHIFSDVINAKEDAQPLVGWKNIELRRFKNQLYIMPALSEHDTKQVFDWNVNNPLEIKSLGVTLKPSILKFGDPVVTVRFRQGGEKIFISERRRSVSLKNVFNELGIPPWLRSRTPLIYVNEILKQVVDIRKSSKNYGVYNTPP